MDIFSDYKLHLGLQLSHLGASGQGRPGRPRDHARYMMQYNYFEIRMNLKEYWNIRSKNR